jgi:hypothetical protein
VGLAAVLVAAPPPKRVVALAVLPTQAALRPQALKGAQQVRRVNPQLVELVLRARRSNSETLAPRIANAPGIQNWAALAKPPGRVEATARLSHATVQRSVAIKAGALMMAQARLPRDAWCIAWTPRIVKRATSAHAVCVFRPASLLA